MIVFEFERALAGWWAVTAGRSLDDLEYTVLVDGERHRGGFYRLENLIALYECTVEEMPSEEHPLSTGYDLLPSRSGVELIVAGERVSTTYDELETALATFLGDAFSALDQNSEPHEFDAALKHMGGTETLFNFAELYERVSTS